MLQAYNSLPDYDDFDIVELLFDPHMIKALRAEAYTLMPEAIDSYFIVDDADEWRGGSPARSFQSTPGGVLQTAFFRSPEMIRFLNQWSGFDLEPSGERGTYSYYMRPGDHLSIHRDVDSCEFVLITCLHSAGSRDESSGALCLYPTRTQESISAIRANSSLDVLPIHLGVGQSIIMRGGVIPHALLPLQAERNGIKLWVSCLFPGILQRLDIDAKQFTYLAQNLEHPFKNLVGNAYRVKQACHELGQQWVHGIRQCEKYFPSP